MRCSARGLARHIVDDTARITTAVQRTGRTLQHFHAFDVEQLRYREACIGITAQTVVEHVFLAETAQGNAGIAEEADAADAAIQVGDLTRGLVVDQLARHDLDRLRDQFQRRVSAGADSGIVGAVKRLRAAADFDLVQILRGVGRGLGGQCRRRQERDSAAQSAFFRRAGRGMRSQDGLQMRKISICKGSWPIPLVRCGRRLGGVRCARQATRTPVRPRTCHQRCEVGDKASALESLERGFGSLQQRAR